MAHPGGPAHLQVGNGVSKLQHLPLECPLRVSVAREGGVAAGAVRGQRGGLCLEIQHAPGVLRKECTAG